MIGRRLVTGLAPWCRQEQIKGVLLVEGGADLAEVIIGLLRFVGDCGTDFDAGIDWRLGPGEMQSMDFKLKLI